MIVPVLLILGQLSLWYQARPLQVGEDAVVTLKLSGDAGAPLPDVRLEPIEAIEVTIGPIRVPSKREVCWSIQARQPGHHRLVFHVDDRTGDKDLVIGSGFMRVSSLRLDYEWKDALLNPSEQPFDPDSPIRSIAVDYPERPEWISGSNSWVIYWFILSMVSGLCFRRFLNVNI